MKIITENKNLLIIKNRNILTFLIGIIFFSLPLVISFYQNFNFNKPLVFLGLIGILIISTTKTFTIIFDKTSKKIKFISKSLIRTNLQEYAFDSIKQVELQDVHIPTHTYFYRLVLKQENDKFIVIDTTRYNINTQNEIGRKIANFIHIPFTNKTTLHSLVSDIKSILVKFRIIL